MFMLGHNASQSAVNINRVQDERSACDRPVRQCFLSRSGDTSVEVQGARGCTHANEKKNFLKKIAKKNKKINDKIPEKYLR